MSKVNFNIKFREVKDKVEQVHDKPELRVSLCTEIQTLYKQANTVSDMSVFMETLEVASTCIDHQYDQNSDYWKKKLNDLSIGLLNEVRQNESGWKNIENYFTGIFPDIVNVTFLFNGVKSGVLKIANEEDNKAEKTQKVRIKKKQQSQCLTKPIRVLSQTSSKSDSYKTKMQICLDKLYEACNFDSNIEIPFYTFAINCKSFIQTVYNIFMLAFLVREHLASLSVDQNHQLWIRPVHTYNPDRLFNLHNSENKEYDSTFQTVLSINPREWMMLTQVLGLNTVMLPILCSHVESFGNKNEYQRLAKDFLPRLISNIYFYHYLEININSGYVVSSGSS